MDFNIATKYFIKSHSSRNCTILPSRLLQNFATFPLIATLNCSPKFWHFEVLAIAERIIRDYVYAELGSLLSMRKISDIERRLDWWRRKLREIKHRARLWDVWLRTLRFLGWRGNCDLRCSWYRASCVLREALRVRPNVALRQYFMLLRSRRNEIFPADSHVRLQALFSRQFVIGG